jgi:hypothetical protein
MVIPKQQARQLHSQQDQPCRAVMLRNPGLPEIVLIC